MSRSPSVPNLMALAHRVSELEGKRLKYKSAPRGRTFAPSVPFDPMALKSDQGPSGLATGLPATPRLGCSRVIIFFEGFTRRHVAGHT